MFKRIRSIFGRSADEEEAQLAPEAVVAAEDAVDVEAAEDDQALGDDSTDFAEEDDQVLMSESAVDTDSAILAANDEMEYAEDESDEEESDASVEEPEVERTRRFNIFRTGLQRTRGIFGRVNDALARDVITDELWDDLEESLLEADVGVQLSEKLMETLRERARYEGMKRGTEVREALKEELQILLGEPEELVFSESSPITVYLVVGVNGVGKTTSIAKLANMLKRNNHRVLLAAGDTFRAAAIEQLRTWGDRLKVPVVSHQQNSDPAAVVFDAMESAQARKTDVLIVDTAGRLHTKSNLMEELKKIERILARYDAEAPHEVLLVLDATTGQNAILQAKTFVKDVGCSGIILTKLDGTARGGVVFSISSELGLPIKFIGTGEQVQDLAPFDPQSFVDALFAD